MLTYELTQKRYFRRFFSNLGVSAAVLSQLIGGLYPEARVVAELSPADSIGEKLAGAERWQAIIGVRMGRGWPGNQPGDWLRAASRPACAPTAVVPDSGFISLPLANSADRRGEILFGRRPGPLERAMIRLIDDLLPAMAGFRLSEQIRAATGALIGICLCSLLVVINGHISGPTLMLVAPLGATAVLVFAVPNSPLAQPWSAVVGNVVSTLVALAALIYVPAPWTGGVAVGGAILAMMLLRALHPPGGAVALLSVLDPDPVLAAGAWFALMPVAITTALLVCAAVIYNRLSGRVYPFRHVDASKSQEADPRLGLSNAELGALLVRFNQSTNLGVADLGRLLAAAEEEAAQHRFDGTTCADIMTREVITASPDAPLPELAKTFRQNDIKSIPVMDEDGGLVGLLLQADLMAPLIAAGSAAGWRRNRAQLKASDLMRPVIDPVPHDLSVGHLLNRFAVPGTEVVMVTANGQLAGILTRSDIIGLLLKGSDERRAA